MSDSRDKQPDTRRGKGDIDRTVASLQTRLSNHVRKISRRANMDANYGGSLDANGVAISDPIPLWVPKNFAPGTDTIYMLPASHRGDMYHLRGAICLHSPSVPLCIFENNPPSTDDMSDYLARSYGPAPSPAQFFLTAWSYKNLVAEKCPAGEGAAHFERREFKILSESDATDFIAKAMARDTTVVKERLSESMAIISPQVKIGLTSFLTKKAKELFAGVNPMVVLVLYRDSGATGSYPELDTGSAWMQLMQTINNLPKGSGTDGKLTPILCGNPNPIENFKSIGEYWQQLESKNWPTETKRDIEAYFLLIAFELGLFSMTVGFRSGVLDLFTFLQVPTVSISLRQLNGEARHCVLAKPAFQRMVIEYEQPRQAATRFFTSRRDRSQRLMGSPWWDFDHTSESQPADADKVQLQSQPPGAFSPYDTIIMNTGFTLACQRYLKWDGQPAVSGAGRINQVFTNANCRATYPSNIMPPGSGNRQPAIKMFYERQQKIEQADWDARYARLGDLGESATAFGDAQVVMQNAWAMLIQSMSPKYCKIDLSSTSPVLENVGGWSVRPRRYRALIEGGISIH